MEIKALAKNQTRIGIIHLPYMLWQSPALGEPQALFEAPKET